MVLDNFIENFNKGLAFLLQYDRQTLTDQGHRASGRLIDTLEYEITIDGNVLKGIFTSEDYGLTIDSGIPAGQILRLKDYQNDPSFRRWVNIVQPQLRGNEIDRFIYYVWAKWKREGQPTKSSRRFSKTGERLNWIKNGSAIWEKEENTFFNIEEQLDVMFETSLDLLAA